jgi:hypothetical protein
VVLRTQALALAGVLAWKGVSMLRRRR